MFYTNFRAWPEPNLVSVRAWDRYEKRSVYVARWDWDSSATFSTVWVSEADRPAERYAARKADLDFRYFGEPPWADEATRREWARRAAADRRDFWRYVARLSDRKLLGHIAEYEAHGGGAHFLKVARTERDNRVLRNRTVK